MEVNKINLNVKNKIIIKYFVFISDELYYLSQYDAAFKDIALDY